MHLGMIGAGHIGNAILQSVLDGGCHPPENIWVSCPEETALRPLAARGCHTGDDNRETVSRAELIILAVRPPVLPEVLREIAPVAAGKCFLSVVAGVSIQRIKSHLPADTPVMRAMPNMPLLVGRGATALSIPRDVPCELSRAARDIFECAGVVEPVAEELLAAATALNGSGPGYFFRIAGLMLSFARERGIPEQNALPLIAATMEGTAELLRTSDKAPCLLADMVAVPGGTTQAAFDSMDISRFDKAFTEALNAAADRALELAEQK